MGLPYWFSIESDIPTSYRGGAFLITRQHALTATHCLPDNFASSAESAAPTIIQLTSEDGTELLATISEISGDMALLEILAFGRHNILAPPSRTETVDRDSLWEAPYRPSKQHPTLTGVIGNPDLSFECADGSFISALQLTVSEGIGDHSGYSGGPVVTKASDSIPSSVLGVLIEQFPDQANSSRAANVLFAARIAHAFEHFAAFEFARQLKVSHATPPGFEEEQGPESPVPEIDERLSEGDKILKQAKSWAQTHLINDYEYTDYKARVRDLVFAERPAGR